MGGQLEVQFRWVMVRELRRRTADGRQRWPDEASRDFMDPEPLASCQLELCSQWGSENTSSSDLCGDRSVRVRQHTAGVHLQAWTLDTVR